MAIPYRTSIFKSANILIIAVIWGSTAKFNARQYFWLYGIYGESGPSLLIESTDSMTMIGVRLSFMYTVAVNKKFTFRSVELSFQRTSDVVLTPFQAIV